MTHTSVLTRTAFLTQTAMFSWRTHILTAAHKSKTSTEDQTRWYQPHTHVCLYSQCSSVTGAAHTLSAHVMACCVVLTLTLVLAVVSVGEALTNLLTAPAAVSGRTDAHSAHGVTQRPVLTLTTISAVRTPVTAVTRCKQQQHTLHTQYNLNMFTNTSWENKNTTSSYSCLLHVCLFYTHHLKLNNTWCARMSVYVCKCVCNTHDVGFSQSTGFVHFGMNMRKIWERK